MPDNAEYRAKLLTHSFRYGLTCFALTDWNAQVSAGGTVPRQWDHAMIGRHAFALCAKAFRNPNRNARFCNPDGAGQTRGAQRSYVMSESALAVGLFAVLFGPIGKRPIGVEFLGRTRAIQRPLVRGRRRGLIRRLG